MKASRIVTTTEAKKLAQSLIEIVGELISFEVYFKGDADKERAVQARKAIEEAKAAHRVIADRFDFNTYS